MPEKFLYRTNISATLEQVGGVAVPQAVRAHACDFCAAGRVAHALPSTLTRKWLSPSIQKKIVRPRPFCYLFTTFTS